MARTTTVKKARKDQGKCGKCGTPLPAGSAYKWVKIKTSPYSSRRMVRCLNCPGWRPSELTTSEIKGTVYGYTEAADDALAAIGYPEDVDGAEDFVSELEQIRDELADGMNEAAELCKEKAQAIEDGFGHSTYQSEELEERGGELESFAESIESVDFEAFDPPEREEGLTDDEWEEELAQALSDWADQIKEELESELGNCPE